MEKLKRENAALKKKLEESSKSKMSDAERNKLFEKILDLETQKVKNSQDMSRQDEIARNRTDALNARNRGLVLAAGEARRIENISSEIRKQIPEVPPRIVQSKTSTPQTRQDPRKEAAMSNVQILEAQLKDALEKNQQWLVYDQQREAYVQGLMSRIFDLEQQVASTKQNKEQTKEISCDAKEDDKQKYYDRLLIAAKKDLEGERQITGQLNSELAEMRLNLNEKKKEAADLSIALKSLSETEWQQRDDDRRHLKDKMQRLRRELDVYREMYEEERRKNSDLTSQIEMMENSLLRQQEDQLTVAALEQQIQKCTSDLENEKIDRHNVQHQLYKVLKELRKTQEQITKLEPGKRDIYFVDSSANFMSEFDDKLSMREKYPSPKPKNLLDESFLTCPRCQAMYPTSQHRELLAHVDICTS
ncbi:PREDICTED: centrosomal protein of 55 kDa [Nanorana parkeri]|uniref:centrosomal protein of 55 kDa n=1 Tax=Nanorana parkeri TaxID=125878 RepID=UPI0008544317|nr:PREDICTED: centrosomal protein of 55 kDa [Nanorana parkeri]